MQCCLEETIEQAEKHLQLLHEDQQEKVLEAPEAENEGVYLCRPQVEDWKKVKDRADTEAQKVLGS